MNTDEHRARQHTGKQANRREKKKQQNIKHRLDTEHQVCRRGTVQPLVVELRSTQQPSKYSASCNSFLSVQFGSALEDIPQQIHTFLHPFTV